jgi:hypothetical protein
MPESIQRSLFGKQEIKRMHARTNDFRAEIQGEARNSTIDPRYWMINSNQPGLRNLENLLCSVT